MRALAIPALARRAAYLQTGLPRSTCEGFVAAPTVAPAAAPNTNPTDGAPSSAPPTRPATAPIPAPLAARSPCVAPQADSRNAPATMHKASRELIMLLHNGTTPPF